MVNLTEFAESDLDSEKNIADYVENNKELHDKIIAHRLVTKKFMTFTEKSRN